MSNVNFCWITVHESLLTAIVLDSDPCDRYYSPMEEYKLLAYAHQVGYSASFLKGALQRILDIPDGALAAKAVRALFDNIRDHVMFQK